MSEAGQKDAKAKFAGRHYEPKPHVQRELKAEAEEDSPDQEQGPLVRFLSKAKDGSGIQVTFFVALGLAAVIVSDDLVKVWGEAKPDGDWKTITRTEPLILDAPTDRDQVRPYLPKTRPSLKEGRAPDMPGMIDRPTSKDLSSRMTFRMDAKGNASAVGRIGIGTSTEFTRFMNGPGQGIKTLSIHSPGGSVVDAMQMARLVRRNGVRTIIPDHAYCASSCPLFYAGGVKRTATPKSWIGVHQVYTNADGTIDTGMAEAQRISAKCQQFLNEMGVDTKVWIHAMETPSASLYYFTPRQLKSYKLATLIKS